MQNSKLKSLIAEFESLKKSLNLEEKQKMFASLEAKSSDPSFWNDQEEARKAMQKLGDLGKEIDEVKSLEEDLKVLKELSGESQTNELDKDIKKTEERLKKLTIKSYLSGVHDSKNAVFTIHAGQGGTEAMDWTSMLYRMYVRFCERKGWNLEILDQTVGEEAGFKSISFLVTGSYSYGYLKGEAGTHRLVRQSPFNADKLRQTSFALVEVMPELAEVDLPDIEIKEEDCEWQFFRAGSQGGQNVNKVSTAVRLIHKPSGLVVTAQTERFQEQNRKIALNLLRSRLWIKKQEELKEEKKEIKGEYRPASWGTQIRSYVLHPYKMVKDLRTKLETGNSEAVLDGDLDQFIDAELKLL